MPAGRPTKYLRGFHDIHATRLAMLGLTNEEIAANFGVDGEEISRWANEHEEFSRALKAGREDADAEVANSLYRQAVGFDYYEESAAPGGPVLLQKRHTGNTTAAIFWLKNRRQQNWREKREEVITGPDGGPVVINRIELVAGQFGDDDESDDQGE